MTSEYEKVTGASVIEGASQNYPAVAHSGNEQEVRELVRHDLKLQIVERVNQILASTIDAEIALQDAVSFFQQVFDHRGCAVYLADIKQDKLALLAASGEVTGGAERALTDGMMEARSGVVQYSTPLWRGEEIIGLLRVEGALNTGFREYELETIESFARQASVALRQVLVAREARQAREKFLDLYRHAHDGYFSFPADGTITEINDTQLTWLGYKRDDVVGRWRVADLLIASGSVAFPDFLARLMMDGKAGMESEMICSDGGTIPVRIHARAGFREVGESLLCHATVQNITDEKKLLAQLELAQQRDSIGHLVGVMAHEFNNLLTGIIGFSSLAQRQIGTEHRAIRSLREIDRAAKGAVSLVSQLLAYGRSQLSRPEPVELNHLTEETVKFLRSTLPDSVSLSYMQGNNAGTVHADPGLIQQVVLSLCAGAHLSAGEKRNLSIETGHTVLDSDFVEQHPGARPGSCHFIRITDNGTQMSEEARQQLFDHLFSVTDCADGNSLRLAMAQRIICSHDGYLAVESGARAGTIFTIYLPAVRALTRSASGLNAEQRGGSETIMVVDDEPMVAGLVQELLGSYGYRVLTAANGRQALSLYQSRSAEINLVITDVVMPEMPGPELCREIQRLNPCARVLLTSGYSTSNELRNLLAEGVPYIQKPYQGDDLVNKVRQVLDANQSQPGHEADQYMKSCETRYDTVGVE